jgi:hypothetical protein
MGAQDRWDAQIHAMDGKCVARLQGVGDGPVSVEALVPGIYQLLVRFGEGEVRSMRLVKE